VAYALSRRVHELHATAISIYQSELKDRFVEARKSDLQYMELVTKLQQNIKDCELGIDGILLYRNRVCVPNSSELRSDILK
jgi:benzoyl-CoA reductase/2-hydroxyglutaryl-CoA dehydratase subunit BcrC/BadD/HgdB